MVECVVIAQVSFEQQVVQEEAQTDSDNRTF